MPRMQQALVDSFKIKTVDKWGDMVGINSLPLIGRVAMLCKLEASSDAFILFVRRRRQSLIWPVVH